MITIFDYLDYRKFLKDYYLAKKQENTNFSMRLIASKVGCDSGYIAKIIQDERHISLKIAEKFAELLKLNKRETEYFLTMVQFCKAQAHTEKRQAFEKLLSFKTSKVAKLSKDQYSLFDRWYYLAVREILACIQFDGDFEMLGKLVQPSITAAKARKAVELLMKLKLVKKNKNGIYERVEAAWTTGTEVASVAINNFQMSVHDLAKQAYDLFPRKLRNMSTLTLSISEDEYKKIVEDIAQLRRKFLEMAKQCRKPDRVMQLNIAAFPVSKVPTEVRS